jgi:hypothetical protein
VGHSPAVERVREEQAELPEVTHSARAELAAARSVQSQREQAAATAARLSPPDYITRELGGRPTDSQQAAHWDKAVRGIERYRVRNGVVDRDTALGPKPQEHARQHEQRQASERFVERVADLGIGL